MNFRMAVHELTKDGGAMGRDGLDGLIVLAKAFTLPVEIVKEWLGYEAPLHLQREFYLIKRDGSFVPYDFRTEEYFMDWRVFDNVDGVLTPQLEDINTCIVEVDSLHYEVAMRLLREHGVEVTELGTKDYGNMYILSCTSSLIPAKESGDDSEVCFLIYDEATNVLEFRRKS